MVSLLCTLLKIFLFIFVINKFNSIDGFEIYLQQVDVKSPMRSAGVYNIKSLRVIKYNRTAYVFNGDLEFETDLGDTYSVKMDLFHSRLGNSNFAKSPARFEKDSFCNAMKKLYASEIMADILATSNFPKEHSCPFPKGKYWIKNFQLDSKKTVPWAPEGLWRSEIFFYDPTDKEFLRIDATARVEQGSMLG